MKLTKNEITKVKSFTKKLVESRLTEDGPDYEPEEIVEYLKSRISVLGRKMAGNTPPSTILVVIDDIQGSLNKLKELYSER